MGIIEEENMKHGCIGMKVWKIRNGDM